jgi:hypothetical protein
VTWQRGGPIIRKCSTCRQKVFAVEHDEIEPIGAPYIGPYTGLTSIGGGERERPLRLALPDS